MTFYQPPSIDAMSDASQGRKQGGSVAQATVATLQAMIRDGRLKPGDVLPPQRDLARDLKVSRATLREALSILATIGEIAMKSGGRGFVCAGQAERGIPSWRFAARYSLRDVYQFRYVVESYASVQAALTHSEQELVELRNCLQQFRANALSSDLVAYAQMDFEFHQMIMRMSRNQLLIDMQHTFSSIMLESQRFPTSRPGDLMIAVQEHEDLLEAIAIGDPDGASYYMRKHINMAGSRAGLPAVELP